VIASVDGAVTVRRTDHVVIECAGVGYRLAVSAETLRAVPAAGKQTLLHTHLVLRDDGMHLYGFATEAERQLFLLLISVQGVGPKVALAVLSAGAPRDLLRAIAGGDAARFRPSRGSASAPPSGSSSSCGRRSAPRRPMPLPARAPTTRARSPARASSGSASACPKPTTCSIRLAGRRPRR